MLKSIDNGPGISYLDETSLIRDTLYLMQGISGKYVKFSSLNEGDKRLDFPTDLVGSLRYFLRVSIHLFPE